MKASAKKEPTASQSSALAAALTPGDADLLESVRRSIAGGRPGVAADKLGGWLGWTVRRRDVADLADVMEAERTPHRSATGAGAVWGRGEHCGKEARWQNDRSVNTSTTCPSWSTP